ncbi:Clr5 domain-containing protein [Apiospora rasikravindrae]|uniref:Clr5 domain-containing protein n=1 Tax=Apiospora rasikravindrae TaxID=990691 RepID=A0ABR1TZV2_9PEZI
MAEPALLHSTLKRPVCREDWEEQYAHIRKLWWDEDESLERVMSFMEKHHHFQATAKQYKTMLKEWNLLKNVPTNEMKAIVKIQTRRRPKDTEFMVRGRVVPQNKIDRFVKRTMGTAKASPSALSPITEHHTANTPFAVWYVTPLPSPRRDVSKSFLNSLGFTPGNSPNSEAWFNEWVELPPDSLPKAASSASQSGLVEMTGLPSPSRAPTLEPTKGKTIPQDGHGMLLNADTDLLGSWSKVEQTYNVW